MSQRIAASAWRGQLRTWTTDRCCNADAKWIHDSLPTVVVLLDLNHAIARYLAAANTQSNMYGVFVDKLTHAFIPETGARLDEGYVIYQRVSIPMLLFFAQANSLMSRVPSFVSFLASSLHSFLASSLVCMSHMHVAVLLPCHYLILLRSILVCHTWSCYICAASMPSFSLSHRSRSHISHPSVSPSCPHTLSRIPCVSHRFYLAWSSAFLCCLLTPQVSEVIQWAKSTTVATGKLEETHAEQKKHIINCLSEPPCLTSHQIRDRFGRMILKRGQGRLENVWRHLRSVWPQVCAMPFCFRGHFTLLSTGINMQ